MVHLLLISDLYKWEKEISIKYLSQKLTNIYKKNTIKVIVVYNSLNDRYL
jgi:hypothetical protein